MDCNFSQHVSYFEYKCWNVALCSSSWSYVVPVSLLVQLILKLKTMKKPGRWISSDSLCVNVSLSTAAPHNRDNNLSLRIRTDKVKTFMLTNNIIFRIFLNCALFQLLLFCRTNLWISMLHMNLHILTEPPNETNLNPADMPYDHQARN